MPLTSPHSTGEDSEESETLHDWLGARLRPVAASPDSQSGTSLSVLLQRESNSEVRG